MLLNLPCMIHIVDSDPNAFDGIDHEKIGNARIKRYQVLKPYLDQRDGKYQWTIVALPSVAWANKFCQTFQMLMKNYGKQLLIAHD